jgi:REP element-mobilizing transposase RayT
VGKWWRGHFGRRVGTHTDACAENYANRRHFYSVSFHRRRLPHWYPDGKALFLTWHLHGALPQGLYPPPGKLSSGQAFVWMDRYLDTTRKGPMFLRLDSVAQLVKNSLETGERLGHYRLHAWVVMANHVHILITPEVDPTRSIASLKGVTARAANKLLGRTGEPFWQAECYDRWVRGEDEFRRLCTYIEQNPVKVGLVTDTIAFRWSSAHQAAR